MGAISRAPRRPGVVEDTGMCGSSLRGNRETPRPTTGTLPIWSASGRRGAVADDARTWGVRLRHSSCEANEQSRATGRGVGGAKGGGRGECEPAKHAPGTVPGARVTGAGAHTARRENIAKCRYIPEVGAVCLNWASTDLCGGREVTRVPTAIIDRRLMRGRIGYLPPVRVRRDKTIRRGSGASHSPFGRLSKL